jgi:pilus assembly protein Flp/PilA
MFLRLRAMFDGLKFRAAEERGATAVEYALMVALIAVVIIVAVQTLGTNASSSFDTTATAIGNS